MCQKLPKYPIAQKCIKMHQHVAKCIVTIVTCSKPVQPSCTLLSNGSDCLKTHHASRMRSQKICSCHFGMPASTIGVLSGSTPSYPSARNAIMSRTLLRLRYVAYIHRLTQSLPYEYLACTNFMVAQNIV